MEAFVSFIYLCALFFEKTHLDIITCQKMHYLIFEGLVGFSFLLHPPAEHQRQLFQHKSRKKVGFFLSPQSLQFLICFFWIWDGYFFFWWFARKLQKLLICYVFGFSLLQSCHGLEAIWVLHWELFGDLHCWCFLTGMMTLSLVIPHFSLAHVSGVCGMSSRSVTEMMSERRCHCYVFGSLLQSCLGLEVMWLLDCAFWGPTLLMLLDMHNDSQSCNSPFLSCNCVWVFFTVCKKAAKPFWSVIYFGALLQSCHGLEAIWLLHWELFGNLHLLMLLGRHDWVL